MPMAAETCLSDLPDDLLQHILYLVPAREATSTAVLSWRWRSLLPTPWSGATVHLDSRTNKHSSTYSHVYDRHDAFLQGAKSAMDAHESVTRVTIHVEEKHPDLIYTFFMSRNDDGHHVVDDVLTHPACRGVEVLRIEAFTSGITKADIADALDKILAVDDMTGTDAAITSTSVPVLTATMASAPPAHNPDIADALDKIHAVDDMTGTDVAVTSALALALTATTASAPLPHNPALWELHITNCNNLTPPPPLTAMFFPCLAVLRLQSCGISLDGLQVSASPELDTLHLDYVYITTEVCRPLDHQDETEYGLYNETFQVSYYHGRQTLSCPSVTAVFLDNCCYAGEFAVEIDAPRVRQFRYSGHADRFPMKSPPPPNLTRVDLQIIDGSCCHDHRPMCTLFWNLVKTCRSTRALKLKLACKIENIAVADKGKHEELIGDEMRFDNLEHLELDVKHGATTKEDAAVAIQTCSSVARRLLTSGST
ncbi:hypothetical protein PR202_gn00516 [Eleusine coracana subsp. coracana]|uniref:F-box domain-containing protein n=1 Tax=Eleusine coracana subsp. coracana TaxID=191504 RepID=A0AAV5G5P3_ELECO|nr:hypothetical protein PR202_gn00516 [Eleusine coracana subsp. coracana]